jgi:hypothetical protein
MLQHNINKKTEDRCMKEYQNLIAGTIIAIAIIMAGIIIADAINKTGVSGISSALNSISAALSNQTK